ncbi:MAG: arylesterase [Planktotalea sp.]|uniref:arylesterase n=1 Tax=Planktotalea sp. TaxID=2029877 RepID=UPI003C72F5DE
MRKSLFAYGPLAGISKAIASIALVFALAAPLRAEQITLVAFGDSLTQGYGLLEHEGFVPQMRAWLAEQGADVRLVNAGVSGDTTAGGAARIEWTLTDDIQGIAVALGGNDLLRGLSPEQARANIEAILRAAQAKGVAVLLVGMIAPANYGAEYKAEFDAIYPELSETYESVFAPSFFLGLQSGTAVDPAAVQGFMQGDGIHPNAAGVTKIVEGLGPYYLKLIERVQGASSLEKS